MTLDAVLGTRTRVRVLRVLCRQDDLSGRRVAALAGLAPSACKAALEELAAMGLVLRTEEKGRTCHELNRSHRLLPGLERLFAEEARLPDKLLAAVRGRLAELDPSPELLCAGVSGAGDVVLALSSPCDVKEAKRALAGVLRFEFGMRLVGIVTDPRQIPAGQRFWARQGRNTAPGLSERERRQALRFFAVPDAKRTEGSP